VQKIALLRASGSNRSNPSTFFLLDERIQHLQLARDLNIL